MKLRRRDDAKGLPNMVGAQRHTDPPHKPLKFQLGVAARKYPVQLALLGALLVLSVPVWLLVQKGGDLTEAQRKLERATEVSQEVFRASQEQRASSTRQFCEAINENARYSNQQTDELRKMILQGAASSRAFNDLYTSRGLPGYEQRLKMANDAVERLEERKIPVLNCDKYVAEILDAAKQPPAGKVQK